MSSEYYLCLRNLDSSMVSIKLMPSINKNSIIEPIPKFIIAQSVKCSGNLDLLHNLEFPIRASKKRLNKLFK